MSSRCTIGRVLGAVVLIAVAGCGSSSGQLGFDSTAPPTNAAPTVAVSSTSAPRNTSTNAPPASTEPSDPTPPEVPERVRWNGGDTFMLGANLPWVNFGCDFGCGLEGGISSPASASVADQALQAAQDAGMNVVRWWLFTGDLVQFVRDDAGLPVGLTEATYDDLDAAIALAEAHGLALVMTLFTGPTQLPASWYGEPGLAQLTSVLGELFARYRGEETIMTWDVMNEPEFDIWSDNAQPDAVRSLIGAVAAAVHQSSSALVSVGGARMDGIPLLKGLGLDYYTVHWYDPMTTRSDCLACVTAAEVAAAYDLDEPLVVGEFYAGPDHPDRFDLFFDGGYAGAFAWSLLPDRTQDGLVIDLAAASDFARRHAPL